MRKSQKTLASSLSRSNKETSCFWVLQRAPKPVLTHSRCKRENQNASNSAAFNEIATSQQLLLSRLPLGFAAFDQRPCSLPDTRSWRFIACTESDTAGEFNESIGNWRRLVRPARHRALMLRELDSNVGSTCAHWPHEMNSPAVSRMRKSQ